MAVVVSEWGSGGMDWFLVRSTVDGGVKTEGNREVSRSFLHNFAWAGIVRSQSVRGRKGLWSAVRKGPMRAERTKLFACSNIGDVSVQDRRRS